MIILIIFLCALQIADALYYNASLTLATLQRLGVATEVFNLWFQMLQQVKRSGVRANFKRYICHLMPLIFALKKRNPSAIIVTHEWTFQICREHDKKVCCLGLTSLIGLPAEQLPVEALQRVIKATLELLIAYRDQVEGPATSS